MFCCCCCFGATSETNKPLKPTSLIETNLEKYLKAKNSGKSCERWEDRGRRGGGGVSDPEPVQGSRKLSVAYFEAYNDCVTCYNFEELKKCSNIIKGAISSRSTGVIVLDEVSH